MSRGRVHSGPFADVQTFADVVLGACKKSPQFLDARLDLCVLAALIKAAPAGAMVRLRPELARRLVEELAAASGDRERVRNALLKKAGKVLAQLRRDRRQNPRGGPPSKTDGALPQRAGVGPPPLPRGRA